MCRGKLEIERPISPCAAGAFARGRCAGFLLTRVGAGEARRGAARTVWLHRLAQPQILLDATGGLAITVRGDWVRATDVALAPDVIVARHLLLEFDLVATRISKRDTTLQSLRDVLDWAFQLELPAAVPLRILAEQPVPGLLGTGLERTAEISVNGIVLEYLATVQDSPTHYYVVLIRGLPSRMEDQRDRLREIAASVTATNRQ